MVELPFEDRSEAGRMLGAELSSHPFGEDVIVLALPRGGLPVASEVAKALNTPLDVLVVRKLGVPWQPELAMGAIAGKTRILDHKLIRELQLSEPELEAVVRRERMEASRREQLYRDGLPPCDLHDRTVVLVDDGLATGSTMIAAVRHVRSFHPRKVIVAVPVGSAEACSRLKKEADDCICLVLPQPFFAVGEWYSDFRQVTDLEVQQILKQSQRAIRASDRSHANGY